MTPSTGGVFMRIFKGFLFVFYAFIARDVIRAEFRDF
jgi:hypothetical protein